MNEKAHKAEVVDDQAPQLGESTALAQTHETAISASAAQAKAAVEARFVMAVSRPRDLDTVRTKLRRECQRPGFAEVARYSRPVGKNTVEGPSIRFAEAAIRNMGNIDQQTHTIYDSGEKRILKVECTDLETNTTYSKEITISKTVERRNLRRGQRPLGSRTNSYGDTVYIVEAAEGELAAKQDAEISKALRTLSLRLLPGDILDECMTLCIVTTRDADAKDPDAARKKIADAFDGIGVTPAHLKEYLGHDLSSSSPAETEDLRAVFGAVRDGLTSWTEVMAAKKADAGAEEGKEGESKMEALKRTIAAKQEQKARDEQDDNTEGPDVDPDTGEVVPSQDELDKAREGEQGDLGV